MQTSSHTASDVTACPACGQLNRLRAHPERTPRCGACGADLPWLVEADEKTFASEVAAGVPVLLDLWAPWCGPCRMVAPVLQQLAREHAGKLKVVKVNVDNNPSLSRKFNAMSIPLLVVLKDGVERDRVVGAQPKQAILQRLQPYLS